MGDRMPTPEEFAAAAKELADAREAHDEAKREVSRAQNEECDARNRFGRAEAALRAMTDRVAPLTNERGRLVG
jgi:predicted  nucleic acid-binding Zn-ribbon protein